MPGELHTYRLPVQIRFLPTKGKWTISKPSGLLFTPSERVQGLRPRFMDPTDVLQAFLRVPLNLHTVQKFLNRTGEFYPVVRGLQQPFESAAVDGFEQWQILARKLRKLPQREWGTAWERFKRWSFVDGKVDDWATVELGWDGRNRRADFQAAAFTTRSTWGAVVLAIRAEKLDGETAIDCPQCGQLFVQRRRNQRYCSRECTSKAAVYRFRRRMRDESKQ